MFESVVQDLLRQYSEKHEPQITFAESAEIARRGIKTIYDWSSRGLLDGCRIGSGRGALLARDAYVRILVEQDRQIEH